MSISSNYSAVGLRCEPSQTARLEGRARLKRLGRILRGSALTRLAPQDDA